MGYNHHGKRNNKINKGLPDSKYPRCKCQEDWEYVILYDSIDNLKQKYIKEIREKLLKIAKTEQDKEMIELIIKDLNTYIYQKEDDFETT